MLGSSKKKSLYPFLWKNSLFAKEKKNPCVFSLPPQKNPLFFSYLYGSPLPWNIFISFLEMRVDMGSLLGDFPKDAVVSCLVSDQILSMLTFLSKKPKESLLQPTICVLCTKWPLPSYGKRGKLLIQNEWMVHEFIQIVVLMWCGWIKNASRMSRIPQGCVLNAPKVLCLLHSKNNMINPHSSLGPIGSLPILWQRAECMRETSYGWFLCWMASITESDPTPACRLSLKKTNGACLFLENSDGGVFLGNYEMPPPLHSHKHSIWLPLILHPFFPKHVDS